MQTHTTLKIDLALGKNYKKANLYTERLSRTRYVVFRRYILLVSDLIRPQLVERNAATDRLSG